MTRLSILNNKKCACEKMDEEYTFHYVFSELGLCRNGEEAIWADNCHAFLLDDAVTGIKLRMSVTRYGAEQSGSTVRKRVVLYKDEDCKAYAEAYFMYENWKDGFKRAKNMSMDAQSAKNIEEMYRQSCEDAVEVFKGKVVCQLAFEYSMPLDMYEDTLTLTLPINPANIIPDTIYRLAVVDLDEQYPYCDSMPWLVFFRCNVPIEQVFIPRTASLRVRPVVRGRLLFDKAQRYKHYKDFFADIHYDEICEEVEVNPVLVCFEIQETQRLGKEYTPIFTIMLTSEGKDIYQETARLLSKKNDKFVAFATFPGEYTHLANKEGAVLATLEVLGHVIAHFDFNIKRNEEGEYVYDNEGYSLSTH